MSIIDNTRAYKIKRIRQLIAKMELRIFQFEENIAKLQAKLAARRVKLGYIKSKFSGDLENLTDAELNKLYTNDFESAYRLAFAEDDEKTTTSDREIPPPPEPPKKPDLVISEERYW